MFCACCAVCLFELCVVHFAASFWSFVASVFSDKKLLRQLLGRPLKKTEE